MSPKAKYVFKVILVGDGAVGKTSLILRFTEKKFSEDYKKTLGTDFAVKQITLDDNTSVKLQIWDLGGQEIFRNLRKVFFPGAKAALIVFDITNRTSFNNVENWFNDIQKEVPGIPTIIVGNKIDLPRDVSFEEAQSLSQKLGCDYIETSAKLDRNVDITFINIAKKAVNSAKGKLIKQKPTTLKQTETVPQFEFKLPRTPSLTPPQIKLEMPAVFEKPNPPSFNVTALYEWFKNNREALEILVEDLFAINIDPTSSIATEYLKGLRNFFIENNIDFDYREGDAGITAWYGTRHPSLALIVDLSGEEYLETKKTIIIISLIVLWVLRNYAKNIAGRVSFNYILNKNEGFEEFISKITSNSDYLILLSNQDIDTVGIMPKIITSIKLTVEKSSTTLIDINQLNNFLLRFISYLVEPKLRVFYNITLPVSKINIRTIQLANSEIRKAFSNIDFQVNNNDAGVKILNTLDGIKNRLKEENPAVNISIEELKSDLNPFVEEDAPLLLAIRDTVHFNLKKIIKVKNGAENTLALTLAQFGKPIVIYGSLLGTHSDFLLELYDNILIPARVLAGIVIDVIGRDNTNAI
ncbi:MAG: GTP-binding protein [Candidatus Odinarchaeia archaeon]